MELGKVTMQMIVPRAARAFKREVERVPVVEASVSGVVMTRVLKRCFAEKITDEKADSLQRFAKQRF
jgi:hypothetical protein